MANLDELSRTIGRLEQKITDLKETVDISIKTTDTLLRTHDGRIKKVEEWQNQTIGKISIIAVICGAIGWGITTAVSYFLSKN